MGKSLYLTLYCKSSHKTDSIIFLITFIIIITLVVLLSINQGRILHNILWLEVILKEHIIDKTLLKMINTSYSQFCKLKVNKPILHYVNNN